MWRSTKCSKPYLTYFRHLKHFHESPIVKYSYNSVSYIIFLLLFSYYLLFAFEIPKKQSPIIHWTEILVIIIVTTMFIEEIRQVKKKQLIFILIIKIINFSFFVKIIEQ
jgi:hypothetical protein